MIGCIVVPLDGSLKAEAILPHIRRVLYRNDSEIILVRAVAPIPMDAGLMSVDAALGAAREYLYGQKEKLDQAGVRVKFVVRMGNPIDVVLKVVEEEKATMIALATHGATGLSRFLLGSVAEGILRISPVPVLVVRPFWCPDVLPPSGDGPLPLQNLLVPVSGGDSSFVALPDILELAALFGMRVVLMRVLEPGPRKAASGEAHAAAEHQLREFARTVEKAGVETRTLVVEGDPPRQILDAIRGHAIDLIAMTTHGRTGFTRLVEGSVTERVLRSATVPLLVTRIPDRKPEPVVAMEKAR